MTTDLIARFEDKYMPEPNSGCWIWLGAVWSHPQGARGKIWISGVQRYAYRVAYELFVGPVPEGLFVCHRCDTPICVNPGHLWVGTHDDNMADMVAKGRNRAMGTCRQGSLNTRAKLTETDVRAIRADGSVAQEIATRYGVSRETIRDIKTRKNWSHLT